MSEDSDDKADKRTGEEGAAEREIKVTDRRMFTPDGELREEYRQTGDAAGGGAPETEGGPETDTGGGRAPEGRQIVTPGAGSGEERRPPSTPSPSSPSPSDSAAGPPVDIPQTGPGPAPSLLDLVGLLAEPVPLYLGDAELPDGRKVENLEAARLHIDLLDVLRRKTAGNLTSQESAVLEDVIYRLRMRYVQKRG